MWVHLVTYYITLLSECALYITCKHVRPIQFDPHINCFERKSASVIPISSTCLPTKSRITITN